MTDPEIMARRRGRRRIVLLAALFALPPVLAFVLYHSGWRPSAPRTHGELLQPPRPIEDDALVTLDGKPMRLSELRRKWTLVYFGPAECLKPCTDNLHKMRQVHIAQGKDEERVQRVFLVSDPKALDMLRYTLKDYPGTLALTGERAAIERLARQFSVSESAPTGEQHRLYIVDPLGNLMMSYPAGADATGLRKDLGRLLRTSQVG
jgi:cytochrome oxidase Cu insertion factor (SCO1/SenC/PrrC family)